MYYQSRDMGIQDIIARKNHSCYGMGLGIMILDEVYPGFPGDVRNASAFPYPIQYEIVKDLDIDGLLYQKDKSPFLEPILDAARKLESMGCRALAAECGYFAWFQEDVAGAVDVPVFMSSLLQIPLIQRTIGPKKSVGILCYRKEALTETHLKRVGVDPNSKYFINGASDDYQLKDFDTLWCAKTRPEVPVSNFDNTVRDIVAMCKDMKDKNPDMGALMLECTGMQPFARAIQREIDLPVYSWGTLLDYAYSTSVHREYYGHV